MNSTEEKYNIIKQKIIDTYFASMNEKQKIAISNLTGSVLILAGAGSGKTTVIVNRILNMIAYGIDVNVKPNRQKQEHSNVYELLVGEKIDCIDFDKLNGIFGNRVNPWNILAITFTNKASRELRERIERVVGSVATEINTGTFHWLCAKILRKHIEQLGYNRDFTIYDTDDSKKIIKNILKNSNINEEIFSVKFLIHEISKAKDNLLDFTTYKNTATKDCRKLIAADVYETYQNTLKKNNALDFDDIIMLTVKLFENNKDILQTYQNKFKYILIDEYQDTNHSQFKLIKLLSYSHNNICVVGDDDQSIYKFRGANIENILSFEKYFPGTKLIRLEQNYRSTKVILEAANNLIANNKERKIKNLWTNNNQGNKVTIYNAGDEYDEANFVVDNIKKLIKGNECRYNDCTVLYRTNVQSNIVENVLTRSNIPYRIFGGLRFYDRKEIKDVLAYMSILVNENDEVRLLRIINEPKRGIGDATIATIRNLANKCNVGLYDALMSLSDQYNCEITRQKGNVINFVNLIEQLKKDVNIYTIVELVDIIIEKTAYKNMLKSLGPEGEGRLENINELKSNILNYCKLAEKPNLDGFLNEIALYTDLDIKENEGAYVNMMTLHTAKGLEFENVFIIGLEDGLFPNNNIIFVPNELEEERRLAYVGFTRAKKNLFLTHTTRRTYLGKTSFNKPSRFLQEIPENLCKRISNLHVKTNEIIPKFIGQKPNFQNNLTNNNNIKKVKYNIGNRVYRNKFGDETVKKYH